tara:strand:+ start:1193 stop:2851 length:1659 start_codon:yes stop_codon:yes gene_type:complete
MAVRLGAKITGNFRKHVEREIMKFRGDHYLWHKHISGIELNPHQVAWMNEMDGVSDSHMLIGSRRIRKSFTVAAYFLEEAACLRYSEVNVHSPALEQSKRNLRYMTDMVMNSDILMAYLDTRLGEGLGKEHIEFMNRSQIQAKGQASSVDGLGATHQWLEEFDDMDWENFLTRIYPTGSQIKDDHQYGKQTGCCRVITGTIKGIGNIYNIEHPAGLGESAARMKFNVLPKFNCWHGVEMGIIPENDIYLFQGMSTPHQFARTYLVLYVESSAFYPDRWLRQCVDNEYIPVDVIIDKDIFYKAQGDVTVGIDCAGAGSGADASNWSITFTEKIGNQCFWLYSEEWTANERPDVVIEGMRRLFVFFRPRTGFGDAFDTAFLYDLNRVLMECGVTRIDVRRFENKAGGNGWDEWFVKPIRFTGPTKHLMHERMQKYVYACTFRYPAIVDGDTRYAVLQKLLNQFGNIKAERALTGYNKYTMLNTLLGDDAVDSCIASVWAQEEIKTLVLPVGGSVPQMEFAERRGFTPLGPKFLNDMRKKAPANDQTLFGFLKSD